MTDKSEKIVALVQPEPNKDLVAELKAVLEQAERGEFVSVVMIKRTADGRFGTKVIGLWSALEKVGALTFVIFDIMDCNKPEVDK